MCPPLTDEPPTPGGGRGEGPDRPFASVTSRLARHYCAMPEKHSRARVRESKSSQPPQACFPKSYRTPRCNLSSEAYSYLSDRPRCQNRPLQQAGRHQAPFEPGARGSASPHRATLGCVPGSHSRPALGGEPTPARGARTTAVAGSGPAPPGAVEPSPGSRAHRGAPPPATPALAFRSRFPSNLCERLFSPLGCLFLAQAESGVRGRGRGPPRRAVPLGVPARAPSAGAGRLFPSPRGPAPGQQRPAPFPRVRSPRRYRWRAGPGPPSLAQASRAFFGAPRRVRGSGLQRA